MDEYEDDGEFQPQEDTIVAVLTGAICQVLNEKTPAQEWDDQTKQAVGLLIQTSLSEELGEVIEMLKTLEPLMVGIFSGPGIEALSRVATQKNVKLGEIVAQTAFDAMNEGHRIIVGSRRGAE